MINDYCPSPVANPAQDPTVRITQNGVSNYAKWQMKAFKFAGEEFDKVSLVLILVNSHFRSMFTAGPESASKELMAKLVISFHHVVQESVVQSSSWLLQASAKEKPCSLSVQSR